MVEMREKAVVYFGSMQTKSASAEHSLASKFDEIVNKLGIKDVVKGKRVAIKIHLGSNLGYTTVHPFLVGRLVKAIKAAGGNPYLMDIIEQYHTAIDRGYTPEVLGAQIFPVAGIADNYFVTKDIHFKNLEKIEMGGFCKDADVLIDLSHVKGHNTVGFGGAVKNLAIGCYTQRTRWALHHTMQYDKYWDAEKSKDAEELVKVCPYGAIKYSNGKLRVEFDMCNQCMRCVHADKDGCLRIQPQNFLAFPEAMAITTQFVLSHFDKDKVFFINVATNITEYCDCWGFTTGNILPDVGFLGSNDILAVDKASLDLLADKPLIRENVSRNLEIIDNPKLHPFARIHGPWKDPYNTIKFGEKYGLGNPNYELVEVLPAGPEQKWPPAFFPDLVNVI